MTLTEGVRGPEDRQVADVAAQLADVYLDQRDTTRAEPLYQRALAIFNDTLGREHPAPGFVQSRLARLYQLTGERLKAEALIRQGLEVIEHALGPDHLLFVRSLTTLQALRENARDFEQAGEIIRRQQAILEKIGYANSVLYAQVLSSLGGVYNMQHDARAEATLQRSLTLCETLRGTGSNCLPPTLVNLGVFARDRGDNAAAEAYYRRAFAIRAPIVGVDNPDLVPLLNNLANVYHAAGDDARALDTHFQALRIEEKALGPYHRYALLSTGNIAIINTAAGNITTAIGFQRRSDAIIEKQLTLNMAVGSERQKLAFVRGVSERTDRTISLHLQQAPDNPDAEALAALVVLQRKGRVLDAMTDLFAAARQRVTDSRDQGLLDQLNATTAQLARFALNAPEGTSPEARQAQIKGLEGLQERLEGEIGARDAEFRVQTQPVSLPAVQAAIPEDAALLEFAVFRPFDAAADQNSDAYGPPRYAAYILRRDAAARGVDLGPAQPIDEAIAAAGRGIARSDAARPAAAGACRARTGGGTTASGDRRCAAPVGVAGRRTEPGAVRRADRPAGPLPRRALCHHLSHQRPRSPAHAGAACQPEPAADRRRSAVRRAGAAWQGTGARRARPPARPGAAARPAMTCRRCISPRLPEPERKAARSIGCSRRRRCSPDGWRPRRRCRARRRRACCTSLRMVFSCARHPRPPRPAMPRAAVTVENPLLRSGLALAGANLTRDPVNDGILTALEASGLNLWGTKLVTLSACDTGVGEVRNGEGLYGLRRAFVLAGAETLVMSLWPVSDYMTREMMTAYYTGLRAGVGRGDALRQAKLAMLARHGRQHPFYWASFIQSGEWANLDGRR